MVLLSNTPRTIVGLEGYGLNVVEQRPIVVRQDRPGDMSTDDAPLPVGARAIDGPRAAACWWCGRPITGRWSTG